MSDSADAAPTPPTASCGHQHQSRHQSQQQSQHQQQRLCSCSPPGLLVRFDPKQVTAACSLSGHGDAGFRSLRAMRQSGCLCDLTLVAAGGREVPCHRLVLACWSPLFRAPGAPVLSLLTAPADAEAVGRLVDFCYTGRLHLDAGAALPMLDTACALQLESAARCCELFVINHLLQRPAAPLAAARDVAVRRGRAELLAEVDGHLVANYRRLADTPDFLDLPAEAIEAALRSDRLEVADEVEVFASLLRWLRARPGEREPLVDRLLPHVRLTQLPADYLTDVVSCDPLLQGRRDCTDLVLEACAYQLDGARGSRQLPLHAGGPSRRPRKTYAGSVFCVGGRGSAAEPHRSVEVFDLLEDAWFPIQSMRSRRRHCGLAVADGLVYAVGGHDGDSHLATVEAYSPDANDWLRVARMSTPRRGLALAALAGCLFAVGGLDDSACFAVVERYDPAADRWAPVAATRTPRGGSAAAALDTGRLLVCGGNDSAEALSSCELYDPVKNMWLPAAHMRCPRAGAAAAATADGCVCVIGGFDDRGALASGERYDPRCDRWLALPDMATGRGGLGGAVLWGRLYALGGHDGSAYLSSAERLDLAASSWEPAPGLSFQRAGAGVCVAPGCPIGRLRANRLV